MRRRFVVVLLATLALIGAGVPPAVAQEPDGPWTGTWDTDQGTWVLQQTGDRVFGSYEPDAGRIFGTVVGETLTGSWAKAPTYAPPDDSGDVELTLDPSGAGFTGRWSAGGGAGWQDITGERTGDVPAAGSPAPPAGDVTLTRVPLPAGIGAGRLTTVVTGGPGWIAAGSSGAYDRPRTLILTSVDGLAWSRVPLQGAAAAGEIADITPFDGGFAAIGRARTGAAAQAWLSADGLDWQAVTADAFAGTAGLAITTHEGLLFAIGCRVDGSGGCGGPAGWTSPDGLMWSVADPGVPGTWELADVIDLDGRLLAVGTTAGAGAGAAAAAFSDDAAAWDAVEAAPVALFRGVAMTPDGGALAAGSRTPAEGYAGLLMRSDDGGGTWTDTGLGAGVGTVFEGVATNDQATIVFGGEGPANSEPVPAAWWVDPAGGLRPASMAEGTVLGIGEILDLALADGSADGVAVGAEIDGEKERPGLWFVSPRAIGPLATPAPAATATPAPTPQRTAKPRPTPTPRPVATAAERYLLRGLSPTLRASCEPRRRNLPEGSIAAIDCRPDLDGVTLSTFYLMTTADANATLAQRRRTYLGNTHGWCDMGDAGDIGEEGWAGTGICYLDEEGRPNLRSVEDIDASCHPKPLVVDGVTIRRPTVYVGVLGTGSILKLMRTWDTRPTWWAYPDGKRGVLEPGTTGGTVCRKIAPKW